MSSSISVYSFNLISQIATTLQNVSERLQKKLLHNFIGLATHLSKLLKQSDYVSRDRVELIFLVHKAFVVGFILALVISTLKP
ncbi:MAG: hypothetical protein RMI56_03165 [Sulfolobales archaeon]|nr:hypothetical protein [Sulfolobales archaeon]MDW8082781.1 hypothetical protein [Sulfolobales archaeon]